MKPAECYIVRIYRRDEQDDRKVVGSVESVGSARRDSFMSPEELWSIVGRERSGNNIDRADSRMPK